MSAPHRRLSPRGLLRARPRLYSSIALCCLVIAASPSGLRLPVRFLIGWDCGIGVYLTLAFMMMIRSTEQTIRRRAIQHREGRWTILAVMTLAACASLFAIGQILGGLKELPGWQIELHLALAGITIVGSWVFVNMIFAQIYAHEYYGPSQHRGAPESLDFPGEPEPDYWDFLYFSTVIGMTCQVSDVPVRTRVIRRVVLVHSVISFFFNTVILALSVNIAASLL
ncbi:MAG: DUF1345 domain-containing protein [Aliidongia sp.]